jgi:ATP-dependent exoDNAse (exonuclease V) alpha subunit
MNMVKLGYAISIHKSQGGGFKKVILCTPRSHIFMLNSNLLYVGLTRMKEKLYHLGSLQSVNQAVKKKANLTLAYAISIHKSQGGGFKTVILCTPQSHIFMLNSNLLYVGLTRMKEKLYHLGSLQSVNQAVKKKANLTRHTFMQNLLKNTIDNQR